MTDKLQAQPAKVEAQVVVRDKLGNVKYQGPLVMEVTKEKKDGDDPLDSGP